MALAPINNGDGAAETRYKMNQIIDAFGAVDADVLADMVAAQAATEAAETSAVAAAADFATVFDLADVPGASQITRLRDLLGRMLLEIDADAQVGITMHLPINHLPDSIHLEALNTDVRGLIPHTFSDDVNGYLYRIKDAAGHLVVGVKQDGREPITAYVDRARTADNAEGAVTAVANANFLIEVFVDGAGVSQLRSRRRADGRVVVLTSAGVNSVGPQISPDDIVMFSRGDARISIPAQGGVETALTASTTVGIVGDSMTAAGSGYFNEVASALAPDGLTVIASAEGGEQTNNIAVSFGVPDLCTLAVTGNALPTSGVAAFTPSIGFLNDGACCFVEVTAANGEVIPCIAYNATGNFIRPVTYPGAPIALTGTAPMRCISVTRGGTDPSGATLLSVLHQGKCVIRSGRNDIGTGRTFVLATYLDHIARMVALLRPVARELLVGDVCVSPGDVPISQGGMADHTQAQSQGYIQSVLELNAGLRAAYPDSFISFYENLQAEGFGQAVTVNGTVYQMINSTALPDSTHEAAIARTASANLVRSTWITKGII